MDGSNSFLFTPDGESEEVGSWKQRERSRVFVSSQQRGEGPHLLTHPFGKKKKPIRGEEERLEEPSAWGC